MNKHERIKRIETNEIDRRDLIKYVDEAEATEKEHEELKRDVKRYVTKSIEYQEKGIIKIIVDKDKLVQYGIDEKEVAEIIELENKLSKVGEK